MEPQNLEFLKRIAKGIVAIFGARCEAVVHDFSDPAHSLVYIEGKVTHREIGAPLTRTMERMIEEFGDQVPDKLGYKITTEDGKILKCASMFIRDDSGKLEGCLAINFDITDFTYLSRAFDDLTFLPGSHENGDESDTQVDFASRPAESMEQRIDTLVAARGKVPATMGKAEKKEIVSKLDKAGVFMVKGSGNYLAKVFGASRYTVYNYLKEVRENSI
jgi:predicted transcriptional regulator YheO